MMKLNCSSRNHHPQEVSGLEWEYWYRRQSKPLPSYVVLDDKMFLPFDRISRHMSGRFFHLQLKFTPKIGHTFTDERELVVEVPKDLVQRRSKSINENLREVIALDLAKSAALGTFPNEAERVADLYDQDPPIWCRDRPPVMNERPCDHEQNGTRAWRIA
jgi:hypothetical protein